MKIIKLELVDGSSAHGYGALFGTLLESFDANWKSSIKPAWRPSENVIIMTGVEIEELKSILAFEGFADQDIVSIKEIDI